MRVRQHAERPASETEKPSLMNLGLVGQAIALFALTNIDDIIVLAVFTQIVDGLLGRSPAPRVPTTAAKRMPANICPCGAGAPSSGKCSEPIGCCFLP
jgi:hypothetical protein